MTIQSPLRRPIRYPATTAYVAVAFDVWLIAAGHSALAAGSVVLVAVSAAPRKVLTGTRVKERSR